VVRGAEVVVPVLPSHALREVIRTAVPYLTADVPIGCATKGIEEGTGFTMAELVAQEVPGGLSQISVLYGPSFALELAQGLPTAVVCAGAASEPVIQVFHGGALRVYASTDLVGVCIGGSLKNVVAIACGVSDGAGLGNNARAALITRGLAEITRLAVAMGADPLTMAGLAGLGDLVLTCTGALSRNRRVGLALGQGRSLADVLAELGEVAEGVTTARSARELAERVGVELPITNQVHAMLFEGKPAVQALADLMGRSRKGELDGIRTGGAG
jgi:glycerol-3-phosphate dehydrogenase (NAD(P)+)